MILVGTVLFVAALLSFSGCSQPRSVESKSDSNSGSGGESASQEEGHSHRHTNHLVDETSPYLLQHAHNPVDWHPWGEEAFEKARREEKPVFLSVGYSTCYWCHVMERESFENEEIAAILNEHFIAIKVDREERPDVDEQYMLATQLISGRGGWPNSVWLLPDGRPWMAGTYFPREQFKEILTQLADFWDTRRQDVEQQADQLTQAIRQAGQSDVEIGGAGIDQALVDGTVDTLENSFDEQYGGFGGAPKFPPHGKLRLLIHEYRRTQDKSLLRMIDRTLDAMARGGIRDHVGGGFHRYSTDRQWLLPHFEKMLYDNAQLMRLYTDGYLLTKDDRFREVAAGIFEWVKREMTEPDGGFYSAIDSESEGEEGRYYVWEHDEVIDVLGEEEGHIFAAVYGVEPDGNFSEEATGQRTGANVVHLPKPLAEVARERDADRVQFEAQLEKMRAKLLAARQQRPRPHRDDKMLAGWNGLMISSLAYAGRQLDEPRYVAAAAQAGEFILAHMSEDGSRLLRSYREGEAKLPGYLNDYAYFADACLELHAATGDAEWLQKARQLADILLDEFQDPQAGGFFFTTAEHDDLLMRSKNLLGGGNIPSGNGVAAQVLLRLNRLTDEPRYEDAAGRTLESLSGMMRQSPQGTESLILAAALQLQQSNQEGTKN